LDCRSAGLTYGTIAAVIIVGLVLETESDGVVHLLVVGLGGDEGALGGGTVQVEVCTTSTEGSDTESPDASGGGRLLRASVRGISTTGRGTEALRKGEAGAASSGTERGGRRGRAKERPGCGSGS
jgi:hypothetical protein